MEADVGLVRASRGSLAQQRPHPPDQQTHSTAGRLKRAAAVFSSCVAVLTALMLADRRQLAHAALPGPAEAAVLASSSSNGQDARHSAATSTSSSGGTGDGVLEGGRAPVRTLQMGSDAGGASTSGSVPTRLGADDVVTAYERAAVQLFEINRGSVVHISPLRASQQFSCLDAARLGPGHGSGFVLSADGHVLTAYSTVRGAGEVKVTLADQTTATARVMGWDAAKDIAVLKLAMPRARLDQLRHVVLGSSADLQPGQSVFVLGNPNGLECTISRGVLSGLGGQISLGGYAIKNLLQTDAVIGPGSHGGMVLDSRGRVIGVALSHGRQAGALPIDGVQGLARHIMRHGRVLRPSLGITVAPPGMLQQLGLEGVLVLEVPAGSPAAVAGLRPTHRDVFGDIILGDVLINLDTRPIRSVSDLAAFLDEKRVGDKVRCDVLRDGKRLSMTLQLCERSVGVVEE